MAKPTKKMSAPTRIVSSISNLKFFLEDFSEINNFFKQLKYDDKKAVHIKQIAVRLRHPENRFTTNLVNAVYDSSQNFYKAVIDLGDPVQTKRCLFY